MNKIFRELCTPAKIYFSIAVIVSIIELLNGIGIFSISIKLLFAFIWTFILGWICSKGYKSISWFLVALPYIIIFLDMFSSYKGTKEGFRFPFGWNDVGRIDRNKRYDCIGKCREETRQRHEELMKMYPDPMSRSSPEYEKIKSENRQLQTNCYNNCDSFTLSK